MIFNARYLGPVSALISSIISLFRPNHEATATASNDPGRFGSSIGKSAGLILVIDFPNPLFTLHRTRNDVAPYVFMSMIFYLYC